MAFPVHSLLIRQADNVPREEEGALGTNQAADMLANSKLKIRGHGLVGSPSAHTSIITSHQILLQAKLDPRRHGNVICSVCTGMVPVWLVSSPLLSLPGRL